MPYIFPYYLELHLYQIVAFGFFYLYICFLAILPISCIIKCESYPLRLWKIAGIFFSSGFSRSLKLQSWCADPLKFPVIWQRSLTLISLAVFFWGGNMTLTCVLKVLLIFIGHYFLILCGYFSCGFKCLIWHHLKPSLSLFWRVINPLLEFWSSGGSLI